MKHVTCKTCGHAKPITAFYRVGGVENRRRHCAECVSRREKLRRQGKGVFHVGRVAVRRGDGPRRPGGA